MSSAGFKRALVITVALVSSGLLGSDRTATQAVSGRGATGEWDLVWRISVGDDVQNHFHPHVGEGVVFPVPWRRLIDSGGARLVLFDLDGSIEREIPLDPGQNAMAADGGSRFLLWTDDPTVPGAATFELYGRANEDPDWTADAHGAPVLMSPDGEFFVIAAEARQDEVGMGGRGSLQVVGSRGEVRGDLPFFPEYTTLSGTGQRILFLHERELISLHRDGRIDWRRRVPIDHIRPRAGTAQLAAAHGVVVVAGTGESSEWDNGGLHPSRRGVIQVYDDLGTLMWQRKQGPDDDLWFQLGVVLSPDGETLAAYYLTTQGIKVQLFDARSGDLLWSTDTRRKTGFRCLGMSAAGDFVVLVHGDAQTEVIGWDRDGNVAWEGVLPYAAREISIAGDDLLVADRWIVRLRRE